MKKLGALVNILLGGILILLIAPAGSAKAITPTPTPAPQVEAVECNEGRSVQTSGTAVINVAPDRALIQLGVQSNGDTIKEVERLNNTAMQGVNAALAKAAIEPTDIATDWYFVEPVYSSYDSLSIKGYRINNTVAVTLRDITRVNEVISAALSAGANQVINVELYTSELRKYRDQARELAVQAAREKAEALSKAAGAEVGCVMAINENVWSYYNGWYGRGGGSSVWTQNVIQNAAPVGAPSGAAEPGAVTLGQIAVQAEVTATFSLR